MQNLKSNKLKFILLSFILITLGITAVVFLGYRRILSKAAGFVPDLQTKANISIGKVYQTATTNGIKEWSLAAGSARIIHAENQAIFQDLSVTFYLKDNTNAYLTADQGILNTNSNDIEVSGNVVLKKDSYTLKTERLHYKHDRRILFSKVPVKILSTTSTLLGDSISFDLNTNDTVLEGNIKGIFNENILL